MVLGPISCSCVLLIVFVGVTNAYYVTVDAYDEECFFETVTAGAQLILSFEVAEGGFLDIDMTIDAPDGQRLYDARRESNGRYMFSATVDGDYRYCFSNRMSSVTPKTIAFHMHVLDDPQKKQNQDSSKSEELDKVIDELMTDLATVAQEQRYMKVRENVHSQISESTNQRVVYWSLFEAFLLIAMTVGQVFYLKRFFEVRRVV